MRTTYKIKVMALRGLIALAPPANVTRLATPRPIPFPSKN